MLRILVVSPGDTAEEPVGQLEQLGHSACSTTGIREAKRMLSEAPFDVIVLDTGMGVGTGELSAVDLTADAEEIRQRITEAEVAASVVS